MGDDPKAGNPRDPAPGAVYTSPGSGPDRREKRPGIALPADLGRSLRLLDNAQLDRLMKAVADEVRWRGRNSLGSPVGGRPVGKACSGENGTGKTERAGQRRHRDLGTPTADPRRLRGRASSRRPSPRNSGSRGRPCKMLSPARTANAERRSDR